MRTALLIAALAFLPFVIRLCLSLAAAAGQVWRGGNDEAREFMLAGVDLKHLFNASIAKQDSSSLVPTRAGVSVRASAAGIEVRETRTISKEIF